jgi:hypothetical protein
MPCVSCAFIGLSVRPKVRPVQQVMIRLLLLPSAIVRYTVTADRVNPWIGGKKLWSCEKCYVSSEITSGHTYVHHSVRVPTVCLQPTKGHYPWLLQSSRLPVDEWIVPYYTVSGSIEWSYHTKCNVHHTPFPIPVVCSPYPPLSLLILS